MALALVFVPPFALVALGGALTHAVGGGEGLSDIISTLAILLMIGGAANFVRVVVSNRMKMSTASLWIAHSLAEEHGITVSIPRSLVVMNVMKTRLNPAPIPSRDDSGQSIVINLGVDSTGTKVVPVL